ncbi:MAG: signal peptidase I [Gammaproteobacteria bacterium]|nr:signal peptidase I [Gammaproteobacteria bacterium]MBT5406170.1 signal peptidase I [Gammaproteobacteria bacterium]MBT5644234.1 signal peptidase I [Gammaproteobacteria bacterium]MBT5862788.1 signal peptidase I [Gammaproteobacteria bacterium]MBT6733708.1 signal peptidase I [Gammaproteobacteria bacterium]
MDFTLLLLIITLISGLLLLFSKIFTGTIFSNQLYLFFSSFFPILLFVLVFRSFLIEPYRIPSGSMIPTVVVGDFILVKKYEYGIRLPVSNYEIIANKKPVHGDVIVFQYPQDKRINYIKRVIALPGDHVEYLNKVIYVNGEKYIQNNAPNSLVSAQDLGNNVIMSENNRKIKYNIMKNNKIGQDFSYVVPKKTYFVLGDNRDNSNDSRYWGPVPEENLIGKAFFIWMYWNTESSYSIFDRVGLSIE